MSAKINYNSNSYSSQLLAMDNKCIHTNTLNYSALFSFFCCLIETLLQQVTQHNPYFNATHSLALYIYITALYEDASHIMLKVSSHQHCWKVSCTNLICNLAGAWGNTLFKVTILGALVRLNKRRRWWICCVCSFLSKLRQGRGMPEQGTLRKKSCLTQQLLVWIQRIYS